MNKQGNPLTEMAPFVLFFGVWFITSDIYQATAALMLGLLLQVAFMWWQQRRVDGKTRFIFVIGMVFGGATLLFRNEMFIQWKPTVVNGFFAAILGGSLLVGRQTLVERMLGEQLRLPAPAYRNVTLILVAGFTLAAVLNLLVAYNFSLDFWVAYKLWGGMLLTFGNLLAVLAYLAAGGYLKDENLGKASAEAEADSGS